MKVVRMCQIFSILGLGFSHVTLLPPIEGGSVLVSPIKRSEKRVPLCTTYKLPEAEKGE